MYLNIPNLTTFKELVSIPRVRLTLIASKTKSSNGTRVDTPHKFLGIPREIRKVRSRDAILAVPGQDRVSYMPFDKASDWTFNGNLATYCARDERFAIMNTYHLTLEG